MIKLEQNQYAMNALKASNKAINKAVKSKGKTRIKVLRAEALDDLGAEVVSTFKGIELSDAFKAYANALVVADCIKESKRDIINSGCKVYMDMKDSDGNAIFTSEEIEIVRNYFTHVSDVAYNNVLGEIREISSTVERELLENLKTGEILGCNFSGKLHDLKLALFGGKTVSRFNDLVKELYSSTLNKDEVKRNVTDQASMSVRYVQYNLVFDTYEEITWEFKKEVVNEFYVKTSESYYQTRFDKLENVGYLVKGEIMKELEERYNEKTKILPTSQN